MSALSQINILNITKIANISNLVIVMEACALIAAAISGFIEARQKQLDIASTFIVGFISAFGGGTIRDILLDRRPFYWVAHENYSLLIFFMSLFAPLVIKVSSKINYKIFTVVDAIGLGLFTISSTSIALSFGLPLFSASLIGVAPAVFGGVLRDVLLNKMPHVLSDNEPYVTCAFLGAWIYILLRKLHLSEIFTLWASSGVIVILRLLAWKYKIRLPRPKYI